MGKPAARIGDMHTCPMITPGLPPVPHVGGPITGPGCPTVLIGGQPAAVMGDMCTCVGPPDTIILGSTGVLIGGKPAARMGDQCAHGGAVTLGCPTVLIGETAAGGGGGLPAMSVQQLMSLIPKVPPKLKSKLTHIVALKNAAEKGSKYANPAQPVTSEPSKAGFNTKNAVSELKKNAGSTSKGLCARYVRMALQAGGVEIGSDRPGSAKDYDDYLKNKGFSEVDQDNYQPQEGDVVVMEEFKGEKKDHPHGHIQMYDGEKWVSDFEQKDFWPGGDYSKSKPSFSILRK